MGIIGLLTFVLASSAQFIPLPTNTPAVLHTKTYTWYFAATDYSAIGLESTYSPELQFIATLTNRQNLTVTLAWDLSLDPLVVGYNLYYGSVSRQYTNMINVGNYNEATLVLVSNPPPIPLRKFLKVSWYGNGTNIWGSYDLGRSWMPLSYPTNTFTLTNPSGSHVYWMATNIAVTNWTAP